MNVTNALSVGLNARQSKLFQLAAIGPLVFSKTKLTGTNLVLTITGGAGLSPFRVLASSLLPAASSNWTQVATSTFDPTGSATLAFPIQPSQPQSFLRLVTP